MSENYTVLKVADTENGWLVKHNETGEEQFVFCRLTENTEADAIAVFESSKTPRTEEF